MMDSDASQSRQRFSKQEIEERKRGVKATLHCPHCDNALKKWQVPQTVFTQWPNEFMYICFNDECAYFVNGWQTMAAQANTCSYRFMYDPMTDSCQPIPVFNSRMLRDGIIQE